MGLRARNSRANRIVVGLCALLGSLSGCAKIVGIEDTTVTRGEGGENTAGSAGPHSTQAGTADAGAADAGAADAGAADAGAADAGQSNGGSAPAGGAANG